MNRITAELELNVPKNDTLEEKCRVYSDHRDHVGCVDFNVDENGVWVVYRNASRQNIFVSKLNIENLAIQRTVVIRFGNKENPVKFLVTYNFIFKDLKQLNFNQFIIELEQKEFFA